MESLLTEPGDSISVAQLRENSGFTKPEHTIQIQSEEYSNMGIQLNEVTLYLSELKKI